jgi:hypothetical protein
LKGGDHLSRRNTMEKHRALASQIQLQIPMEGIVEELAEMREELMELRKLIRPRKEWYDLADVADMKGIPYGTLTGHPWLKPNGGKADGVIGGRAKWRHETVLKWLEQTDADLPEPTSA